MFKLIFPFLILAIGLCTSRAQDVVVYDTVMTFTRKQDIRNNYPMAVLELALKKSDGHYVLVEPERRDNYKRLIRNQELGYDTGMDIMWSFTTTEAEEHFIPIYIPFDRGLLGWRLPLIHKDMQQLFSTIPQDSIKELLSAQALDWPDLKILQANDFNVYGNSSYDGIFELLRRKRIDFFPRSVNEIWLEQREFGGSELVIEEKWAIYYPAPLYFFVVKERPALAADIKAGLEKALDDGSLERLFRNTYAPLLEILNLKNREVIYLENPNLDEKHPIDNPRYWFDPQRGY